MRWIVSACLLCDEAAEECPYFPFARRQDHGGFPDPSKDTGSEEERLALFEQVRDGMAERIDAFLAAATAQEPPSSAAKPQAG